MTSALAFLAGRRPLDYGARLARLRWRRAAGARRVCEWDPKAPAAQAIAAAAIWMIVADETALPAFGGPVPDPPAGSILAAAAVAPEEPAFVHTLRELEGARLAPGPASDERQPAAVVVRAADFPASGIETTEVYIYRLLKKKALHAADPVFRAVLFGESSERERPELTRRLAHGALRILDIGCGAGGAIAGGKTRDSAWTVTGIEWDAGLAQRARSRCDRVLEGDLVRLLPALERDGERFEAIVFADVLEHLEDPISALSAARRIGAAGARLLVSVPNVGHLSIARDLVAGRFDPIPAGLTDARHLRWFTRSSLEEAIKEAGWRDVSIESEAGAPPPGAAGFLALASNWPDCDRESLATYQWIATATA